jgi:hypothetical protein
MWQPRYREMERTSFRAEVAPAEGQRLRDALFQQLGRLGRFNGYTVTSELVALKASTMRKRYFVIATVQELQATGNALANLSKSLTGALQNPNLFDQTRGLYTNAVNAIKPVVAQINKLNH